MRAILFTMTISLAHLKRRFSLLLISGVGVLRRTSQMKSCPRGGIVCRELPESECPVTVLDDVRWIDADSGLWGDGSVTDRALLCFNTNVDSNSVLIRVSSLF